MAALWWAMAVSGGSLAPSAQSTPNAERGPSNTPGPQLLGFGAACNVLAPSRALERCMWGSRARLAGLGKVGPHDPSQDQSHREMWSKSDHWTPAARAASAPEAGQGRPPRSTSKSHPFRSTPPDAHKEEALPHGKRELNGACTDQCMR